MTTTRPCPLCREHDIVPWRAMCKWCFDTTPWRVRADFLIAYRRRVLDNARYQELLAELKTRRER